MEPDVQNQTKKAIRRAACLNNTIWRNKHLGIDDKPRICKAAIRATITYPAETHADMAKRKRKWIRVK